MKKFIAILWFLVCLQCTKSDFNDFGGNSVISGVAVIRDTLNGNIVYTIGKSLKVYIGYLSTPGTVLRSISAGADGRFSFNGIDLSKSYSIWTLVDTGAVKYYGKLDYVAGSYADKQTDTLFLIPSQTAQNGIHLVVLDSLGGKISGVTASVFNSLVRFDADSGRSFDMMTNQFGVSNVYNVEPRTYYLRVKTTIGDKIYTDEKSVNVASYGIATIALVLHVKPQKPQNGMELTILDPFGTPVNAATVYCYRSQQTYNSDSSWTNSLFQITSNSSGIASKYGIDSVNYFLRTIKIVNSDTLWHEDTIKIPPIDVARKIILLQKL